MVVVTSPQRKDVIEYVPFVKGLLAGYGGAKLDDAESLRDSIMLMMREAGSPVAASGDDGDVDTPDDDEISSYNAQLIKLAEVDGDTDSVIRVILEGLRHNITLLHGSDTPETEVMVCFQPLRDDLEAEVERTFETTSSSDVYKKIIAAVRMGWHSTMVEDMTDYVGTQYQRLAGLLQPPGGCPDVAGLHEAVKEIEERVTEDCLDKVVASVVLHVRKTHAFFVAVAMLKRITTLAEQGNPVENGDVVELQEKDINIVGRMYCAHGECFLLARDLIEGDAGDILGRVFASAAE